MIGVIESILLDKVIEEFGPTGGYLITLLLSYYIARRMSEWARSKSSLTPRLRRALVWPPYMLPVLAALWVHQYTGTPTGRFWAAPSPLVRLQVEIQREPGFHFGASGLDVEVSHVSNTPGNPELWLRYRGDAIPAPRGISIEMAPGAWLTSSVRIQRDCHLSTPLGRRKLSFVVLDDRHTSTVLGVMLQEGELQQRLGSFSGCG